MLKTLPASSVRCCVTSPPYWGLRDYGTPGQLGLEPTPEEYVENMVAVFREVRRVLTDDGTLWLNLGDSYANTGKSGGGPQGERWAEQGGRTTDCAGTFKYAPPGLKPKDLVGIPWRVAFALQADGWWLRSDIIWSKPNPMPESVRDRPTKAHEYVFLLAKSERYYYDADAIAENASQTSHGALAGDPGEKARFTGNHSGPLGLVPVSGTRNARTVWEITTKPYPEAHFATFPEELARRCILAGSASTDTVLDPFGGSGTVAAVAVGNGRRAIHIDLNPEYNELARNRIGPMLCEAAA